MFLSFNGNDLLDVLTHKQLDSSERSVNYVEYRKVKQHYSNGVVGSLLDGFQVPVVALVQVKGIRQHQHQDVCEHSAVDQQDGMEVSHRPG